MFRFFYVAYKVLKVAAFFNTHKSLAGTSTQPPQTVRKRNAIIPAKSPSNDLLWQLLSRLCDSCKSLKKGNPKHALPLFELMVFSKNIDRVPAFLVPMAQSGLSD